MEEHDNEEVDTEELEDDEQEAVTEDEEDADEEDAPGHPALPEDSPYICVLCGAVGDVEVADAESSFR